MLKVHRTGFDVLNAYKAHYAAELHRKLAHDTEQAQLGCLFDEDGESIEDVEDHLEMIRYQIKRVEGMTTTAMNVYHLLEAVNWFYYRSMRLVTADVNDPNLHNAVHAYYKGWKLNLEKICDSVSREWSNQHCNNGSVRGA